MNFHYISIPKTGSRSVHRALHTGLKDNHTPIKELGTDKFSFCFLRDPIDRIQSWFFSHISEYPVLRDFYGTSINRWILRGCPHHWDVHVNGYEQNPLYQWEFININNHLAVDFVGDYSKLNKHLRRLAKKELGIRRIVIPHIGKRAHGNINIWKSGVSTLESLFPNDFELYEEIKKHGCIRKQTRIGKGIIQNVYS